MRRNRIESEQSGAKQNVVCEKSPRSCLKRLWIPRQEIWYWIRTVKKQIKIITVKPMNFSHMPRFINTNISAAVVVVGKTIFGRCRLLKFLLSFHRDNFSLGINWEFKITYLSLCKFISSRGRASPPVGRLVPTDKQRAVVKSCEIFWCATRARL